MKKNYFILAIYISFFCLFVVACSEKDSTSVFEGSAEPALIQAAKGYYQARVAGANLRVSGDDKPGKKLEPKWDKATKNQIENGDNAIVVPADGYNINVEGISFFRCFVFKEEGGQIVDGRIVEFLGDSKFLKSAGDKIIRKFKNGKIPGYTGLVLSYDVNYQYLDGYSFTNGKMDEMGVRLWVHTEKAPTTKPSGRIASTLRTQVEGQFCEPIYWCYVWTNGAITNCVDSGNCNVSSQTTAPPPGEGGSLTTTTSPPASSIKNELRSKCFKDVFNNLLSAQFNNKVQTILSNFNKSSTLSFTIKDAATMSDGNTQKAAETLGNQIVLNSTLMANASQEFVTATIYHEVLHVFINNTETYDHNKMSTEYVTPMIQALMSWFPLSYEDAEALAWSGLQSTPAYPQNKRSDMNLINNKYLNSTYGHACQ
ncbi:hypothetical protein [Dyadobacter diqingensis]|uniref:hypothetical protein n=1 Tax=Dyadobacter diqingensis TaxID=2938121 RepID=UPI0020C51040|nr:hypothetical protein [Dyadobacter diqingensis]